jgi:hypothetical protein
MYPTKEEIEAVFPGKGQEITDLLTGKVQPTAYVSVIRRVTTSIHFTPVSQTPDDRYSRDCRRFTLRMV